MDVGRQEQGVLCLELVQELEEGAELTLEARVLIEVRPAVAIDAGRESLGAPSAEVSK